jgi:hypothetical protein
MNQEEGKQLSRKRSGGQVIFIALVCVCFHVSAQDNPDVTMSQYLFPSFYSSQVKMKSGSVSTAIANYNTLTGKMVFMKDNEPYSMTVTSLVDTVTIDGRKFVPGKDAFYEVLVNAPVSLFIQHKSTLERLGAPSGYGGRSQTSAIDRMDVLTDGDHFYNLKIPEDYKVSPSQVFWVCKDHNMFSFLNKRQLLKIFPDQKDKLEQFIKQNRLKTDDPEDMIKLVDYCNEIIP